MSRIRADKFVNNAATGAPQLTFGAEVVAGVGLTGAGGINVGGAVTAASGNFTGAVTVGGVLTYDDVTNVDSIGIITARGGVSIADSIFHTGDTNTAIRFPAADTFSVETAGSEAIRVDSSGRMLIGGTSSHNQYGSQSSLQVQGTGFDDSTISLRRDQNNANPPGLIFAKSRSGSTGGSTIVQDDDQIGTLLFAAADGTDLTSLAAEIKVEIDNTPGSNDVPGRIVLKTTSDGASSPTERLRITSTGGVHFNNAELIERVSIVGNKLSAVPNVSLDNGMVHYYTTNETTTATPNIISTAGINTSMATGDTMSVTIMSKPNNAGYFPKVSIDGVATGITTYWSGGAAPSAAGSSGVDVNVYQIIKTADATYDVLANTSNFA